MNKPIFRILTVFAIFAGVMLLVGQILVGTAVAAQQSSASTTYNNADNRSTITTSQPVSAPVKIEAPQGGDCVQELASIHRVYLPLTFSSNGTASNARIKLEQEQEQARIKGLTVFGSNTGGSPVAGPPMTVTLDLSEFDFSPASTCVRWWYPSNTSISSTYQFLTQTIAVSLLQNIEPGAQQIMLEFVSKIGIPLSVQTFTFFYIPNGDFTDLQNPPEDGPWTLFSNLENDPAKPVMPRISHNELQLFVSDQSNAPYVLNCQGAKVGFSGASIDLELPSEGEFYLRVQGTVFTQDQNPSNSSTFDAFEVVIDGNVADRVSNMDPPSRCSPEINRQVPVNSRIPLSGYSGNTTISLENHRRFDNQYDTYTEIDMVWIDY